MTRHSKSNRRLVELTRSAAHNRLYWGYVVRPLSEHTGYEPAELHQILLARFGPPLLSTRLMTRQEFSDYIRAVTIWAAEELNVSLPDAHLHPTTKT